MHRITVALAAGALTLTTASVTCGDVKGLFVDGQCCGVEPSTHVQGASCSPVTTADLADYKRVVSTGPVADRMFDHRDVTWSNPAEFIRRPRAPGDFRLMLTCATTDDIAAAARAVVSVLLDKHNITAGIEYASDQFMQQTGHAGWQALGENSFGVWSGNNGLHVQLPMASFLLDSKDLYNASQYILPRQTLPTAFGPRQISQVPFKKYMWGRIDLPASLKAGNAAWQTGLSVPTSVGSAQELVQWITDPTNIPTGKYAFSIYRSTDNIKSPAFPATFGYWELDQYHGTTMMWNMALVGVEKHTQMVTGEIDWTPDLFDFFRDIRSKLFITPMLSDAFHEWAKGNSLMLLSADGPFWTTHALHPEAQGYGYLNTNGFTRDVHNKTESLFTAADVAAQEWTIANLPFVRNDAAGITGPQGQIIYDVFHATSTVSAEHKLYADEFLRIAGSKEGQRLIAQQGLTPANNEVLQEMFDNGDFATATPRQRSAIQSMQAMQAAGPAYDMLNTAETSLKGGKIIGEYGRCLYEVIQGSNTDAACDACRDTAIAGLNAIN